jgi:BON domain
METTRKIAILLLFGARMWAADQHPMAAHQRPPAVKSTAKLTDAQLESAIRAKFAKSKIHSDGFQVHVQGGVAHLQGRTDVVQHKGVATRMAKTAGAVAVNNQIQVSEAGRQKAAGNLEQGRRRAQVKRGEARSQATADPPRQVR